jgi:tetratricopeptide (TPR) repeat protein
LKIEKWKMFSLSTNKDNFQFSTFNSQLIKTIFNSQLNVFPLHPAAKRLHRASRFHRPLASSPRVAHASPEALLIEDFMLSLQSENWRNIKLEEYLQKIIKWCFIFYMAGLLLAACGQSQKETNCLLTMAERCWEHQPDSALYYLNRIREPNRLNKAQYADYHLLRIQAKDKAGQDISADTVICEVKDYFLREKNSEKATLAAFYEGCVFSKDNKRALQAYLEAETFAEHIADTKRKGLIQYNIGWLYYTTGTNYGEAINRLKKAAGYFQAGNYYKYSIEALNLLGTCFLIQKQADSALLYQQQALGIAVANRDTTAWAKTLQSISVTYRHINDNLNAKTYALQAMQLQSTTEQQISSTLNLAVIYHNLHQNDSAAFYANRILQYGSADSAFTVPTSVYHLLAKIAENENDYRRALEYSNKYHALVNDMRKQQKEQSLAGIRERYELELAQIEKQIMEIRTSQNFYIITLMLVVLSIVMAVLITTYIRYRKRFTKSKEENSRLYSRQIDLLKNREQLKPTVWNELYAILTEMYGGAMKRMEKTLTEKNVMDDDFKLCCYAFASFSDKDIAACLNLSPNTVRTKKNEIRKKLEVYGKKSIEVFIMQQLKKETDRDSTALEKSGWNVRVYVSTVKIIRLIINRLYKK